MSEQIDKNKMGLFMGLFNLSVVLPQLIASFGIGKAINEAVDKNLIFIICTITLAISAFLWMLVKEEKIHGASAEPQLSGGH